MKVCILPGITEGSWHKERMAAACRARGWEVIDTPENAHTIISHSGGIFFIPLPKPGQHILLIDPTCPRDKDGVRGAFQFMWWEVRHTALSRQFGNWFWRMCHNLYYILTDVPRTLRIIHRFTTYDIAPILRHPATSIAQSDNKAWFDEAVARDIARPRELPIHYIHTHHDDCWNNPERYLELLG